MQLHLINTFKKEEEEGKENSIFEGKKKSTVCNGFAVNAACVLHFIALDLQTLDDILIMGRKKKLHTHTSLFRSLPLPLSLKL